ncbi:MAG: hypothetical protein HQK51_10765 [Oligoflexia bacterium]|nr:hypothetical protein [Oligoflexia bacterium]
MNYLIITYALPPMSFPRSIQLSYLLKYLSGNKYVFCGDEKYESIDQTICPEINNYCSKIMKSSSEHNEIIKKFLGKILRAPDDKLIWAFKTKNKVLELIREEKIISDVILSFGMPMSSHIAGYLVKQKMNIPWIAHFSDPWVENPYNNYIFHQKLLNKILEKNIFRFADKLIFTSPETMTVVTKKYDSATKAKASFIPHAYDPENYLSEKKERGRDGHTNKYVISIIGNFYGKRTINNLIEPINELYAEKSSLFKEIDINFYGSITNTHNKNIQKNGPYTIHNRINYQESINGMNKSDCLVVIDAPIDNSIFFPSKLAEFIGSTCFIWAITPKGGATDRIVTKMGGKVSDVFHASEIKKDLLEIITKKPKYLNNCNERINYDIRSVITQYTDLIKSITN